MSDVTREQAEASISKILFDEWDPLNVHDQPDQSGEYAKFAHDVYTMLISGASDVQVGRHLHKLERDGMHHEDADARDLAKVLHSLRVLERTI